MLNGHLPNGKENGEHMGLINREKIELFFFFLFCWLGSSYFDWVINDLCYYVTYMANRVGRG